MEDKVFSAIAISIVDSNIPNIKKEDLFIVWSCYILGNRKFVVGCKTSERYFEVTYNKDKDEWCVDTYKKTYNLSISNKDLETYINF